MSIQQLKLADLQFRRTLGVAHGRLASQFGLVELHSTENNPSVSPVAPALLVLMR